MTDYGSLQLEKWSEIIKKVDNLSVGTFDNFCEASIKFANKRDSRHFRDKNSHPSQIYNCTFEEENNKWSITFHWRVCIDKNYPCTTTKKIMAWNVVENLAYERVISG